MDSTAYAIKLQFKISGLVKTDEVITAIKVASISAIDSSNFHMNSESISIRIQYDKQLNESNGIMLILVPTNLATATILATSIETITCVEKYNATFKLLAIEMIKTYKELVKVRPRETQQFSITKIINLANLKTLKTLNSTSPILFSLMVFSIVPFLAAKGLVEAANIAINIAIYILMIGVIWKCSILIRKQNISKGEFS